MDEDIYKYKFSIIMAIYNVGDYIRESIESVIKQSIGFRENIQLILINDGSNDNCEQICMEYRDMYPENIIYMYKENGGVSSAKNLGLKYREGKYINFLDPDDKISKKTLNSVWKFFEKNNNMISYVSIPMYFFERKTGIHEKYSKMGKKDRIINLDIEPYNFTLSSASTFYKTELFNNINFDENIRCAEDVKINFKILSDNHLFGYVCSKNIKYNYRKRKSEDSALDKFNNDKQYFYDSLKVLEEIVYKYNEIPDFIKELIIYETRFKLKGITVEIFDDESEFDRIIEQYRNLIEKIDKKYLIMAKDLNTKALKYLYFSNIKKYKTPFILGENGFVQYNNYNIFPIINLGIKISNIRFQSKDIRLEVLFFNYDINGVDLILKDSENEWIDGVSEEIDDSPFNIKYGKFNISNTIKKTFYISYKENKYSFYIIDKIHQKEFLINNVNIMPKMNLALKDKNIKLFRKMCNIRFDGKKIIIKENKIKPIKYNIWSYLYIYKKYKVKEFFRLINSRKKKYILVNDRPEKASDNGEAIFKYINSHEKRTARDTFFVISKKSPDYKRLKRYGKVVDINSFKHKYLFLNSKLILSSHTHPLFYNAFNSDEIKYYMDMFEYKFIWLQHGIIYNDVCSAANKYNIQVDYMVTSTYNEKNELEQSKYFYDKDDFIFSGMPRYDYLEDNRKNVITIIPTWRRYLLGKMQTTGYNETKFGFEQSEYYKKYSSVLTNKKLISLLEENNYKLKFVLHTAMEGYTESFENLENKYINIVKIEDVNYSKIFSESQLVITDYSSVFFDIAYLKKPLIYYQFDQEEFFSKHYKKGNFEYDKDGFGDTITDENKLIEKIEYYFNNNFKMEEKYINRVENTYRYIDKNNCKRVIGHLKREKLI